MCQVRLCLVFFWSGPHLAPLSDQISICPGPAPPRPAPPPPPHDGGDAGPAPDVGELLAEADGGLQQVPQPRVAVQRHPLRQPEVHQGAPGIGRGI